ncbi:SRPBCC domain-containing protein, partial [Streptomyces asiaticus]
FEGSITCQILKLKQHSEISYTWQGILSREQHKLETTVTWTLQSQSTNQTILKLKQDGFIGFKNLIPYAVLLKTWQRLLSQKLPIAIAKYQAEI